MMVAPLDCAETVEVNWADGRVRRWHDPDRTWHSGWSLAAICLAGLGGHLTSLQGQASNEDLGRYVYAGDNLGAVYRPEATTIRLWAPTARSVTVRLFADARSLDAQVVPMSSAPDGLWSARLEGDQDGKYYLFEIAHPETAGAGAAVCRVNDPYARGSAANSARTLIYDPRKTDPPGWDEDRYVTLPQNVDAILYELHIRDFSIDRSSGVTDRRRGKYLGVVQGGTRTPSGESSGLDHLKELGVTHVHLLPAFDYANGDETETADGYTWYNWGYDPVLYNTPEGSYASDPDGTARQREFKQLVRTLHQSNIGVIMDVVYNHTAATGLAATSVFDKVVPRYFYRFDAKGAYANGSGCGNEVASERPMVRKFIVDSIKYWMTEYHIDGFRFDLMGLLDRETMLAVYREAKRINPNALIYGEGWSMERVLPAERMMTQANVKGTGIAAFNDGIRDNIKGSIWQDDAPGFVQGSLADTAAAQFQLNIKGQSTAGGIEVATPNETVNYASAHDDHCLWDKLLLSTTGLAESIRVDMDKLAAGIVLTAQGIPFLHAGDEFLRSKNKVRNSYNLNDPRVTPIDWTLKTRNRRVFDYYRGLIAIRKAHPAFRMGDKVQVDRSLQFLSGLPKTTVGYILRDHANGDSWKDILVIYNGGTDPQAVTVPGTWTVTVDGLQAGLEPLRAAVDTIRVGAASLVVAHRD
jgi:pullulanase